MQAAICRCSQPLSGFSARCPEDEQMMYNILRTNLNSKYMYVVDTRPRVSLYKTPSKTIVLVINCFSMSHYTIQLNLCILI